jgi:pilus assembly protein Flp/PilA
MKKFIALLKDESGATAIEYGLIAALISIAAVAALQNTGDQLNTTFQTVGTTLADHNTVK